MFTNIFSNKGKQGNIQKKVERLVLLEALELSNCSEWRGPYFAQPKKKSNQVRFLCDFRNLNKILKIKNHTLFEKNK